MNMIASVGIEAVYMVEVVIRGIVGVRRKIVLDELGHSPHAVDGFPDFKPCGVGW